MIHTDPRLAALYDIDNPDGPDHAHYRRLVERIDPGLIVDLGCGTGILTVTLAGEGRVVVGIDPDDGMLQMARERAGAHRVTWVQGDSRQIEYVGVDLVLMTGNVAQHIGPEDWRRTLADIAAGLRPGGMVSFESRNPALEAWRQWTPENTTSTRETEFGVLTEWLEVEEPDGNGTVAVTAHNVWEDTGEQLAVVLPLTFRSRHQISADLNSAGLLVTDVWGGWRGEEFEDASAVMVFEATR